MVSATFILPTESPKITFSALPFMHVTERKQECLRNKILGAGVKTLHHG